MMDSTYTAPELLDQVNLAMGTAHERKEDSDPTSGSIYLETHGKGGGEWLFRIVWRQTDGRDSHQTLDALTENEVVAYLRGALWACAMKPDNSKQIGAMRDMHEALDNFYDGAPDAGGDSGLNNEIIAAWIKICNELHLADLRTK